MLREGQSVKLKEEYATSFSRLGTVDEVMNEREVKVQRVGLSCDLVKTQQYMWEPIKDGKDNNGGSNCL